VNQGLRPTKPDSPTRAKQVAFLAAVAELGTITRAALVAGVHRSMHLGWLEPVVYQGRIQYVQECDARGRVKKDKSGRPIERMVAVRKFSDRLLELHAKAKCRRPRASIAADGDRRRCARDRRAPSSRAS
jgi:hypothetical protein